MPPYIHEFPSLRAICLRKRQSTKAYSTIARNAIRSKHLLILHRFPKAIQKEMTSLEKQYTSSATTPKKTPAEPRPSASILLISPINHILLLHRVSNSTFSSAHVFPGGNLSASQDGDIPPPSHPARHQDGLAYRIGAIRECFEESGILLAKRNDGSGELLEIPEQEREQARTQIYKGEKTISQVVENYGGVLDTESLLPFTRWITPANLPKRFTTQMYIYFLPLSCPSTPNFPTQATIPTPTSDGGIEHTTASFSPVQTWLSLAQQNKIILFPPQFYLLHLLSPYLSSPPDNNNTTTVPSNSELQAQRDAVLKMLESDPTTTTSSDVKGRSKMADLCISPISLFWRKSDGRAILALDKPGRELERSGRVGDLERVVLIRFGKEGPRDVEVRGRREVLMEERMGQGGGGEKL